MPQRNALLNQSRRVRRFAPGESINGIMIGLDDAHRRRERDHFRSPGIANVTSNEQTESRS
jgi:hypothetical protein